MQMHDVDRSKDAGAVAACRVPAPSEGGRFYCLETFSQGSKDSIFSISHQPEFMYYPQDVMLTVHLKIFKQSLKMAADGKADCKRVCE